MIGRDVCDEDFECFVAMSLQPRDTSDVRSAFLRGLLRYSPVSGMSVTVSDPGGGNASRDVSFRFTEVVLVNI